MLRSLVACVAKTGNSLRLRFGVLVHSSEELNLQAAYAAYFQKRQSDGILE